MTAKNITPEVLEILSDPDIGRDLHDLFRAGVMQSIDGIALADENGCLIFTNDAWAAMHGFNAEELKGQHLSMFHSPEQMEKEVLPALDQLKRTGSFKGEVGHIRRDGSAFPSFMTTSRLLDEDRSLNGMIAVMRDITEQKQKEEILHHNKRVFSEITACLIELGSEYDQNVNTLTALCGRLLGATCAFYNRLQGDLLCSLGQWRAPPDFNPVDRPHGHLCHDVILAGSRESVVVRDLPRTAYARTDPSITRYDLKTYVGHAVFSGGKSVGSLCVVYQKDVELSTEHRGILAVIATALSSEEQRRLHSETLRETEIRQRNLLDSLPDMICEFQPDSTLTFVNQPFCRHFHRAPETLHGTLWLELFSESQRNSAREAYAHLTPSHPVAMIELQPEIDGQTRWQTWGIRALFDANESMTQLRLIGNDITERKASEVVARREHANRELINALSSRAIESTDLIAFEKELLSMLGEALDVSRSYIFTYRHETNTMDNTAEWTAPGVSAQIDQLKQMECDKQLWWMQQLRAGKDVVYPDIREIPDAVARSILEPQGIQAIMIIPLYMGGRYYGFMGFDECRRTREWSARERNLLAEATRILMTVWAEQDLLISEQRLQSLLKNVASVAVQGYSLEGTVLYWNQASESFYGYSAEEALGRNLLEIIIPPEMRDEVRQAMKNMGETGIAIPPQELELMRKDGSKIPVFSSHVIVGVPGRKAELFCIDIDLSEHKRIEQEREQLQEQFAQLQKMESIGRLAGGVAHDFNNMLSVINGYGQMILTKLERESPLREYVSEILAAGERSAGLTRQLLSFSRKQKLSPRRLDLNELVMNFDKMLRRLIGEDIELILQLETPLDTVVADPLQLEQVLMNLAVNARDAMPSGGQLVLSTRRLDASPDDRTRPPAVIETGSYVLLTVTDTGTGMDEKIQARIFEPFFTTKEQGRGTGLGLSTVYGIIQQSGGFLQVDSRPGKGSTFSIYLPCKDVKVASSSLETSNPFRQGNGEIILVVEDETRVRFMLQRLLSKINYNVMLAANGEEALDMVLKQGIRPHLLLTDLIMPRMNGQQLIDALSIQQPGLKTLVMSGYSDNLPLDDEIPFLQKPFTIHQLYSKVGELLGCAAGVAGTTG